MRSEGVVGSGVGETLRMKGHACQAQEGPPPHPPCSSLRPPAPLRLVWAKGKLRLTMRNSVIFSFSFLRRGLTGWNLAAQFGGASCCFVHEMFSITFWQSTTNISQRNKQ